MHSRAKSTADHYWPWAVFFKILKFRQGGWGLDGAKVLGPRGWGGVGVGGGTLGGRDGRTFVCSVVCLLARTDGRKFPPLFYRTSSPLGLLPKRDFEVKSVIFRLVQWLNRDSPRTKRRASDSY